MMCGLVNVGEIAVSNYSDPGAGRESIVSETVADSIINDTAVLTEETNGIYADGVHTGSGSGLRGSTEVQVTVENGVITEISVLSYADDRQYFSRAQSGVIANILKEQGIDVKTVSGATFSSNSILEAVADALDLDFTNPNASGKGSKHPQG